MGDEIESPYYWQRASGSQGLLKDCVDFSSE